MKLYLRQLLAQKQIENPYSFLTRHGFTDRPAVKLRKDTVDRILFDYLDRLCRTMWCTPNDLFVVTPEELKRNPLPPGHPLHALIARPEVPRLLDKLVKLPLEKLEEINRLIDEEGKK